MSTTSSSPPRFTLALPQQQQQKQQHKHADDSTVEDEDSSSSLTSCFFPLLPYGYTVPAASPPSSNNNNTLLAGWSTQIGTKYSGSIQAVWDDDTYSQCIDMKSEQVTTQLATTLAAAGLASGGNNKNGNGKGSASNTQQLLTASSTGLLSATLTSPHSSPPLPHSYTSPHHHSHTLTHSSSQSHHSSTSTLMNESSLQTQARREEAESRLCTLITFPSHANQFISSPLSIFNLQLKNRNKYVTIELEVESTQGKLYSFSITNSSTLIRMNLNHATLPLTLSPSWNRISFDLTHLCSTCFKAEYSQIHRVTIKGSVLLRRVWMSDIEYPEKYLPEFLKVKGEEWRKEQERKKEQQEKEKDGAGGKKKSSSSSLNSTAAISKVRTSLTKELEAARKLDSQFQQQQQQQPHQIQEQKEIDEDSATSTGTSYEQYMLATQESRILQRHARTQASWLAFKSSLSRKLNIPSSQLNISRTDAYRTKMEEMDIIEKSIPEREKAGAGQESAWSGSLRGIGHSYLTVGSMFSGLHTRIMETTKPEVQVVRRPQQQP